MKIPQPQEKRELTEEEREELELQEMLNDEELWESVDRLNNTLDRIDAMKPGDYFDAQEEGLYGYQFQRLTRAELDEEIDGYNRNVRKSDGQDGSFGNLFGDGEGVFIKYTDGTSIDVDNLGNFDSETGKYKPIKKTGIEYVYVSPDWGDVVYVSRGLRVFGYALDTDLDVGERMEKPNSLEELRQWRRDYAEGRKTTGSYNFEKLTDFRNSGYDPMMRLVIRDKEDREV